MNPVVHIHLGVGKEDGCEVLVKEPYRDSRSALRSLSPEAQIELAQHIDRLAGTDDGHVEKIVRDAHAKVHKELADALPKTIHKTECMSRLMGALRP